MGRLKFEIVSKGKLQPEHVKAALELAVKQNLKSFEEVGFDNFNVSDLEKRKKKRLGKGKKKMKAEEKTKTVKKDSVKEKGSNPSAMKNAQPKAKTTPTKQANSKRKPRVKDFHFGQNVKEMFDVVKCEVKSDKDKFVTVVDVDVEKVGEKMVKFSAGLLDRVGGESCRTKLLC